MKTLLVGHDSIEFGWALMTWIPYCRFMSKRYEKTIVVCKPGHEYLYADFCSTFVPFEKHGRPDRWLLNEKPVKMPAEVIAKYPAAAMKTPNEARCNARHKRTFVKYGTQKDDCAYDLVIHARACTKYDQSHWNYPVHWYEKALSEVKPKRVCCIGTNAFYVPGTENKMNIPLSEVCDILASSKLCIGTSSGTMHLASLCGCPHVVFTIDKWQKSIDGTNKNRYEFIWNPLDTPVKVLDGKSWCPPVDRVVEAVRGFM
jgi:hypothetical protein